MESAHFREQFRPSRRRELDVFGVPPELAALGGRPVKFERLLSGRELGPWPFGFEYARRCALVSAIRDSEHLERGASFRKLSLRDEGHRVDTSLEPGVDDFTERVCATRLELTQRNAVDAELQGATIGLERDEILRRRRHSGGCWYGRQNQGRQGGANGGRRLGHVGRCRRSHPR